MANYYEDLGLSPQVSMEEIRSAIDTRYNQWRELTTHPDAELRAEAERNQRLLEQIRATLTDPSKRAIYDAGIGLIGTGGLADPEALLKQAAPAPKPKTPRPAGAPESTTLWACHNCGTENPEWTQFCLNCQTELVRLCPECGQMKSLVKTSVCGNCGFSYEAATQRKSLKDQDQALGDEITAREAKIQALLIKKAELRYGPVIALSGLAFLLFLFSLSSFAEGGWGLGIVAFLITVGFAAGVYFIGSKLKRERHELMLNMERERTEIAELALSRKDILDRYEVLGTRKKI